MELLPRTGAKCHSGDVMQRWISCRGDLRQMLSAQVTKSLAVLYREEVKRGVLVPTCFIQGCCYYPFHLFIVGRRRGECEK